jgi:rhomboid protease GluP
MKNQSNQSNDQSIRSQNTPPEQSPQTDQISVPIPTVKPYVMWTILGVTVLLFGLQLLTKYLTKYDLPLIYLAKINKAILDGQFWRFITPAFVHASISHIAFNMIALYSFGRSLEGRLGHFRFLVLYLLAAFAGNVMSFWFTAANSVGASTAVFGLLAAENIFVYQNRKYFGTFARRVFLNTALVAAVNLLIGLTPGIDNWGHLGGLLGGAVFSWFAGPLWQVEGIYPSLKITDQRTIKTTLLIGGGVAVIVAVFALYGVLTR